MISQPFLQELYRRYHRRRYVHPDPLEFLYRYPSLPDREIAGLIAACLAYGRVTQILRSVAAVLNILGPSPGAFVRSASPSQIRTAFGSFRHRFADGSHVVALLTRIQSALSRYGSLNALFLRDFHQDDETILPALQAFAGEFRKGTGHLIASPESGSACKRLNLYLRWMVRKDNVDPGGWKGIKPAHLVIPLDTHMTRLARAWRLTRRRTPDMRMALEVTAAFRRICPQDPVRYDFVLTRFGIRPELTAGHLEQARLLFRPQE